MVVNPQKHAPPPTLLADGRREPTGRLRMAHASFDTILADHPRETPASRPSSFSFLAFPIILGLRVLRSPLPSFSLRRLPRPERRLAALCHRARQRSSGPRKVRQPAKAHQSILSYESQPGLRLC